MVEERPEDCVFFSSAAQAASPAAQALRARGCRVYGVDASAPHGLDVTQALALLREEEGCLYVLCEGGGKLALSMLEAGVVDEFHLHVAPLVLGDDEARPLFSGRSLDRMEEAFHMRMSHVSLVDGDAHLYLRPDRG